MNRLLSRFLALSTASVVGSNCGGSTGGSGGSIDASAEGSGSDASRSSSGGGSSSSGASSSGNTSSSGGTSSGSGGGCDAACGTGRLCCNGACINPFNNPDNCGGCGTKCGLGTYCEGSCKPIPCTDAGACSAGQTCCGVSCCMAGQICCQDQGPVGSLYPVCFTPTDAQPTCAPGCSPLCVSDRNLKRDIEPVDEQAVLESMARVPVSTWSYKSVDPTVRHLGPMAQDFCAAFGLGNTDRAYNSIDAHGVALAAIKALYERSREQDARIDRLEQENAELRNRATCEP